MGQTVYPGTDVPQGNIIPGYCNKFTAGHTFDLNGGVGTLQFAYPDNINGYINTCIQPSITFNPIYVILSRSIRASFESKCR